MNFQMEAVGVLYKNSEQRSFRPFLFSCLRVFLQFVLPRLKASQLSKDGVLYKQSKVQRDSIASSQVAFQHGEGDLVEGMSFFLGGKTPWGKNEEIISKRRVQNNSYFCREFNRGMRKILKSEIWGPRKQDCKEKQVVYLLG